MHNSTIFRFLFTIVLICPIVALAMDHETMVLSIVNNSDKPVGAILPGNIIIKVEPSESSNDNVILKKNKTVIVTPKGRFVLVPNNPNQPTDLVLFQEVNGQGSVVQKISYHNSHIISMSVSSDGSVSLSVGNAARRPSGQTGRQSDYNAPQASKEEKQNNRSKRIIVQ